MFSRKTRKGLLGGVALALAGLMAGEAGAAGGILITKAYCSKFTNPRDVIWAQMQRQPDNNRMYINLFYMKPNGTVVKVFGNNGFDEIDKLFITSHGACGSVGEMANATFARNIRNAQGGAGRLDEIITVSCQAGARPYAGLGSSLLRKLQDNVRLSPVATISGWPGNVVLAGGDGVLSNAEYSDSISYRQPRDAADLTFTTSTIVNRWRSEVVRLEMLPNRVYSDAYRTQCENMLSAFNRVGATTLTDNERERMFEEFNSSVRNRFLSADPRRNPIRSFAYLSSLLRSTADNKITCGPGVGVNCR
ncbi:hypothetical protein SAMN04488518_106132 [Pseudovibrio ascidiaceicola]|uniref:Uncharacterized protein n=1 Tax=Pseudovibrio ascidiaceicola TaxID=285279 RepID=A0A1I4ACJ1_9HYPH|nr:hypothetical protein [Pseudovibrio ascidiaceicola]SFK54115.1 hypothetical protein SAMN04488518_106132 [Pseudovibrio ascidiaceicola]